MNFLTIRKHFKSNKFDKFWTVNMAIAYYKPKYKMEFLIKMSTEKIYKRENWFPQKAKPIFMLVNQSREKYTLKRSLSHRSSLAHEISRRDQHLNLLYLIMKLLRSQLRPIESMKHSIQAHIIVWQAKPRLILKLG